MLIKIIRNDTAVDIAFMEVPEETCDLAIWMGGDIDGFRVVKARLNMMNIRDKKAE